MRMFVGICVVALLALPSSVKAERPPENPETSDYILTGTVKTVFHHESDVNHEYVIAIEIESLEKGKGWKPGDNFYAYCFQRKADAPQIPAPRGHKAVPKVGEKIHAFVHWREGKLEGNYPNWFEVLAKAPAKE